MEFKKKKNLLLNITSYVLIFVYCYFFYVRLSFDLKLPLAHDVTIFATVGRGIVNGFMPYVDMLELKPVGIFLLNFLSYKLTGSLLFSYIFLILCLTIVFLLPMLFVGIKIANKRDNSIFYYTLAICLSSLFTIYGDLKGGRLLPEFFGAFFSCLYIFILNTNFHILRKRWSYLVLGLLMCVACNFKEPFLLIILSSSIIFSDSFKSFYQKFIIPFFIACVMGGGFLLCINLLFPYLEYLYYMVFVLSVSDGQTIIERTFGDINNIFNQLNFSYPVSGYIFYMLLMFPIFEILFKKNGEFFKLKNKILRIIKIAIALFITTMGIHSSGRYYVQHDGFSFPFIFALSIYFLRNVKFNRKLGKNCTVVIYVSLALIAFNCEIERIRTLHNDYFYFYKDYMQENDSNAKYIDAVLDKINEKTYVYIGSYGFNILACTKHSPKGKYFFQGDNWNGEKLPNFYEDISKSVENAKIVVFNGYYDDKLKNKIEPILKSDFTTKIPDSLKSIDSPHSRYTIYYSKKL